MKLNIFALILHNLFPIHKLISINRFWIGTWITVILIIMVAIDASALVCYITRFTEENFATLIAFIFIYKVILITFIVRLIEL